MTDFLADRGLAVAGYHGRMATKRRTEAQDRFMAGEVRAMVATNAFGLGIDKPDIRFVVHYHLPGTVEAYYQEVGRAGRDGQPARGTLFYDPADRKLQRFFAGGRYPDDGDLVNAHHALARFAGRAGRRRRWPRCRPSPRCPGRGSRSAWNCWSPAASCAASRATATACSSRS